MKIRNIIYVTLLLFLQSISNAEGITREGAVRTCTEVEKLSGIIMESRQAGVAMSKLMKVPTGDLSALKEVMGDITINAFEYPRFSTKSLKTETIENFKSKWFLSCYKGVMNVK